MTPGLSGEIEAARAAGAAPSALKALHSSKSVEWYTPARVVDAAREVFGGVIELDPASCADANVTVRARRYFTAKDDGLRQYWEARTLWLNPPYGKTHGRSNQGVWSARLIDCYRLGSVEEACILVNAATSARWFRPLWEHAICFLSERVDFVSPDGDADSPTHSSVVAHLGRSHERFAEVFGRLGHVVLPRDVVRVEGQRRLGL